MIMNENDRSHFLSNIARARDLACDSATIANA